MQATTYCSQFFFFLFFFFFLIFHAAIFFYSIPPNNNNQSSHHFSKASNNEQPNATTTTLRCYPSLPAYLPSLLFPITRKANIQARPAVPIPIIPQVCYPPQPQKPKTQRNWLIPKYEPGPHSKKSQQSVTEWKLFSSPTTISGPCSKLFFFFFLKKKKKKGQQSVII